MSSVTLRRVAIAGLILTILVALDGIYMLVTNYHPDDTSNNTLHMSDGTTVLVAAAILLVVTIIAFVMSRNAPVQPAADTVPAADPAAPLADKTPDNVADTATPAAPVAEYSTTEAETSTELKG
ncbi:hypothetical protein KDH_25210 [Dictyobacter sp. S3.2.2.5]|uniref:Gram-positive cocci surface proteins LPxTG domain-containing protein n=1 Tax=Dictyobacter halimunensis TaxID=3026934 RepID=A0ABQ6FPN8_9CHLR|nr:hypothetical protein KDH_25210 [Dictyobacter sp. S3.2.2.5]